MRFDKPAGTLLLWIPTAWALWLANQGAPSLKLIVYFLLGTVLMRAVGCVINDMADRHIDKHVKRTCMRPLATSEVSLSEAIGLVGIMLLAALLIVTQLPILCFYYASFAVFITIFYPFCKRFIQAPQLVLGVAFSMGIPMAYAATGVKVNMATLLLFIINFAWIVSYDTMYAMADREDDLLIGVKSTAVLFAEYDRLIIMLLQISFHLAWLYLAISLQYSMAFYACWVVAWFILISQQALLSKRNTASCLAAFSKNVWYGLVMWGALIVG
jgi:4-hydroxybenzoate polyprenyltransferase